MRLFIFAKCLRTQAYMFSVRKSVLFSLSNATRDMPRFCVLSHWKLKGTNISCAIDITSQQIYWRIGGFIIIPSIYVVTSICLFLNCIKCHCLSLGELSSDRMDLVTISNVVLWRQSVFRHSPQLNLVSSPDK